MPSDRFRAGQRELTRLLESPGAGPVGPERSARKREIKDQLRSEFIGALGLTPDRWNLARRLFERLRGSADLHAIGFDHVSFYQRDGRRVVVAQPYYMNGKLARWCEENGACAWRAAPEWAHYYPGHATCLVVEFLPPTKASRAGRRAR